MIWAAIASAIAIAVAAGGGGQVKSVLSAWLEQWRRHLHKYVKDDRRRAAATAILDEEAARLETYFEAVHRGIYDVYQVHRRYESTLADYEPFVATIGDHFADIQHAQVAAFFQMRATLSDQEWDDIQAKQSEEIDEYWARAARQDAKREKRKK